MSAPKAWPLPRSMKVLGALFLALSAATPASSVFVIVPDVLAEAGSGALIAMGIAALIAVCVGHLYAELGSAFPTAGGEYVMIGNTLGPLPGFLVLGLNLANSILGAAVLALGVATYLGLAETAQTPVALAVVWGATLLGLLNIRTNALVTGLFVGVEIIALVVLAALGFGHPHRDLAGLFLHPMAPSAHGGLVAAGAVSIGTAVAAAIFAFDGYGSAVYFGEEMREAPRRIGRAILWALAITVVAEVIPLTAILTGTRDLGALLGSDSPITAFVTEAGGPAVARVLGLAVALAIINAVIAMVLLTARQLWRAGRDRTWPAPVSEALGRVHPRLQSPWVATLAAGVLISSLCFLGLKTLIMVTGTGTAVIYAWLCVAVIRGRATRSTAHGHHRTPLVPWVPLLVLAALAAVLVTAALDVSGGLPGLAMMGGVCLAFGLYWSLWLRGRGWSAARGSD